MASDPLQGDHVFENAHHFSIDKFQHTTNIVNNYHNPIDDVGAISTWLTATNHWGFHDEVVSRITPGTGRWFLDAAEFQAWLSAPASALWVTGMPGAGKTGLASIVIEYLYQQLLDAAGGAMAFTYCHYVSRCKSGDILCSFIRQLLEARPSEVLPILLPTYLRHQVRQARLKEGDALQLLRSVLLLLRNPAICIVDGLDEMPEEERDKALAHFTVLPVKLLVFSRSMNIFLERLPNVKRIEMKANGADIEHFVRESVKSSSRLQAILRSHDQFEQKIPSMVRDKCGGMFLIAVLQVEALKRCLNVGALREVLSSIPSGVDKMYEDTLERIDAQTTQEASVARRALLWILHAKRRLTVSELQDALATSYTNSVFSKDAVIDIDIVLSICYGLVTVKAAPKAKPQDESCVALIHYTADSFLRRKPTHGPTLSRDYAVTTLTCTTYLSHHRDGLLGILAQANGRPADIWMLDGFLESRPFFQYAYQYWGQHAKDLDLDSNGAHSATFGTIQRFLLTLGELVELEAKELPLKVDQDGSYAPLPFHFAELLNPAHIAARYGLVSLWPLVKRYGWELTRGKGPRWTALHFAAYHNEVEMVKRLLQDLPLSIVNYGDMEGRTALALAISQSNDMVVRVLLAHRDIIVDTIALGGAVRGGDLSIVQLLLPKVDDPVVPLAALNWLLPGGRRFRPMESIDFTIKMPVGVGANTTIEWDSPTIWLEILGEHDPSDMITLLFQSPGVDINNPEWLGLIQRGERGVDIILAVLRHRTLDVNVLLERAMVMEDQDNASFFLWHPPFPMAISALPAFDVTRALSAARRCGRHDLAQSLLQPPFTDNPSRTAALQVPQPPEGQVDDPASCGDDVDRQLIKGLVDEYIEKFRAEHTFGPPQRAFVYYDKRIDPVA